MKSENKLWVALLCAALAAPALAVGAGAQDEPPPPPEGGPEGPGPRRGPARGPGPEEGPPPSEEELDKVLAFVRENNPEMARHLERARREDATEFRKHMRGILPMYRDPAMRQVGSRNMRSEAKVHGLVQKYRKAEGADKEPIKKDLEAALSEQFDAKLLAQEAQVKRMTEEVAKIQKRIEERRAKKAQIVKKRLAQLAGEGDDWEW